MDTKPLLEGEGLYKLIPQRNPIVMVDTFFGATEESAEIGLRLGISLYKPSPSSNGLVSIKRLFFQQ